MSDPVARLNAALEGRYTIERELGEGGMATVYLADDLKHQRKVALKVLKPELAAVVGADRFLAEELEEYRDDERSTQMDDWTDRDGYRWYVRATSPGGAMATAGQIPDAGKNMIRFQRHNSSESYTVETLYFRDPNKISNEDLQQLLDQAKAEELEG